MLLLEPSIQFRELQREWYFGHQQQLPAAIGRGIAGEEDRRDEHQHEVGDAALCAVADRLSESIRSADTLARVGGDEFVILLSDMGDDAHTAVVSVASKCLGVFQPPFVIHEYSCRLGTSIGIALGDGQCSPDKLLIAADRAMYQAKKAGGGEFVWAEPCTEHVLSEKIDLSHRP